MTWQGIAGHDTTATDFARAACRSRVAGSFLFVGDRGIGKRTFAFALAKTLLCLNPPWKNSAPDEITLDNFVPCNQCESCRLFSAVAANWEVTKFGARGKTSRPRKSDAAANVSSSDENHPVVSHPDLHYIYKMSNKTDLPLRYLTGRKGSASANDDSGTGEREPIVSDQGLCRDLSQRPFLSSGKIAIIDDADFLNEEGANALLKTLEEPPAGCIIILIGTSTARQLPTILSRCRIVRFRPLSTETASQILLEQGMATGGDEANTLLQLAGGSIAQAKELAEASILQFRDGFYHELATGRPDLTSLSNSIMEFIDVKSKESAPRRRRLHLVFSMMLEFDETVLRIAAHLQSPNVDPLTAKKLSQRDLQFFQHYLQGRCPSPEMITRRMEVTLDADRQIDRMVNPPYLIDLWLSRLS